MAAVNQILFRQFMIYFLEVSTVANISASPGTGVAAVNQSSDLRVYTQDYQGGIRESMYEGKWSGGTPNNVIVQGKIGSPLCACSKALEEVG
jgi:hypothetical protein